MGYSAIGSAQDMIKSLERKGYLLKSSKGQARALVLTDKVSPPPQVNASGDVFHVPRLGRIPAGDSLEALSAPDGHLAVSTSLLPRNTNSDELYALKAQGQSMLGAGILDGDWLIVVSQKRPEKGSIVAALLDGNEATVKTLCHDKNRGWFLRPENPNFQPIYASDREFSIMGKVVAVQRQL